MQLVLDLADAIDTEVFLPDALYLGAQPAITLDAGWRAIRLGVTSLVLVVGRRGDRCNTADRLDPVRLPVIVDELDHHLPRRSSSAWAKYAEALRRISLACFNSRFSRSSALIRSRSEVVVPSWRPASRSACRTQLRRVSGVQSILGAIAPMAAH